MIYSKNILNIKSLLIFLLFISITGVLSAQIKKNKKLIVVLHVENQKYAAKLLKKKPEKYRVYMKLINDYNSFIKEAIPKYLTCFSKVEYKTETEVTEMEKVELGNSYFLKRNFSEEVKFGGWENNSTNSVYLDTTATMDFSIIEIIEFDKKGEKITTIATINQYYLFFTKAELFYAVRQLNKTCKAEQNVVEKKSDVLKTKTLIIKREDLGKDLSEAEISTLYPYKFEIVKKADFDNYIINEDKSRLCLVIIPFAKMAIPMGPIVKHSIAYSQYIYDPSNNNQYIGVAPAGLVGFNTVNEKISKSNIETYLKD